MIIASAQSFLQMLTQDLFAHRFFPTISIAQGSIICCFRYVLAQKSVFVYLATKQKAIKDLKLTFPLPNIKYSSVYLPFDLVLVVNFCVCCCDKHRKPLVCDPK